MIRFKSVLL